MGRYKYLTAFWPFQNPEVEILSQRFHHPSNAQSCSN